MNQKKNIIVVLLVVLCTVGSAGATYFYMNEVKQNEVSSLKTDYQSDIATLGQVISSYQQETNSLEDQIDDLNEGIDDTAEYITSLKEKWSLTNTSLQENVSEVQNLRTGSKFYLHDPTYAEVKDFIASDDTEQNIYDVDTFDCENFCIEINNNAEDQGMRCAFIIMYFYEKTTGHMIVGFDTIDQGMVYVEPQTDEWVDLEIGKEYWTECILPEEGYYYSDHPDDTIKEILTFW